MRGYRVVESGQKERSSGKRGGKCDGERKEGCNRKQGSKVVTPSIARKKDGVGSGVAAWHTPLARKKKPRSSTEWPRQQERKKEARLESAQGDWS